MADRVLGSQFLQDIGEFFVNFQTMYEGFVERANAVEKLLHEHRTTFAVVTTLEAAPLREAEIFARELAARRFHLGAMILNKTLPDYFLDHEGKSAAIRMCDDPAPLAASLAASELEGLSDAEDIARVLREVGTSFLNFEVVAQRELELREELAVLPEVVARIPYFEIDIFDLAGLARIGAHLFDGPVITDAG